MKKHSNWLSKYESANVKYWKIYGTINRGEDKNTITKIRKWYSKNNLPEKFVLPKHLTYKNQLIFIIARLTSYFLLNTQDLKYISSAERKRTILLGEGWLETLKKMEGNQNLLLEPFNLHPDIIVDGIKEKRKEVESELKFLKEQTRGGKNKPWLFWLKQLFTELQNYDFHERQHKQIVYDLFKTFNFQNYASIDEKSAIRKLNKIYIDLMY